jgi:LPS-assembly protein
LSRVYEAKWWKFERFKHQIEPEISYTYIPRVDQDDIPIFNELDRIDYTNAITYGLTTTASGKVRQAGVGHDVRELLRFTVSQSYSFSEPFWRDARSGRGRYFSDIEAKLWFNPSPYINVRGDLQYNPYEHYLDGFNLSAALSDRRDDALGLEYRYSRDEVENINVNLRVRIRDWLDLFTTYSYNIFESRRFSSTYGLNFRSKCWGVQMSVEDKKRTPLTVREDEITRVQDDDIKFRIQVTLTGLGAVGL